MPKRPFSDRQTAAQFPCSENFLTCYGHFAEFPPLSPLASHLIRKNRRPRTARTTKPNPGFRPVSLPLSLHRCRSAIALQFAFQLSVRPERCPVGPFTHGFYPVTSARSPAHVSLQNAQSPTSSSRPLRYGLNHHFLRRPRMLPQAPPSASQSIPWQRRPYSSPSRGPAHFRPLHLTVPASTLRP